MTFAVDLMNIIIVAVIGGGFLFTTILLTADLKGKHGELGTLYSGLSIAGGIAGFICFLRWYSPRAFTYGGSSAGLVDWSLLWLIPTCIFLSGLGHWLFLILNVKYVKTQKLMRDSLKLVDELQNPPKTSITPAETKKYQIKYEKDDVLDELIRSGKLDEAQKYLEKTYRDCEEAQDQRVIDQYKKYSKIIERERKFVEESIGLGSRHSEFAMDDKLDKELLDDPRYSRFLKRANLIRDDVDEPKGTEEDEVI